MPPRDFAAPARPVNELTALTQLPNDQKLFLVDHDESEHVEETQPVLDFQGRKHIDTSEGGDVFYTLQDNDTTHTVFPIPGLASAGALYDYLQEHLQPDEVVDEYGDKCDLTSVHKDHLTVLQAKMWTKSSTDRFPKKPAASQPSLAQVLVADHVFKISQLLEEKHIFVLSNNKHNICQYMNIIQAKTTHTCQSQVVRMEPLVDWGTITPAPASQFALTFRRNGCRMRDFEYMVLVRHLIDPAAPTYCLDCLGYLWSKRAEARDTMTQLQSAIARPQALSSEKAVQPHIGRPLLEPSSPKLSFKRPTVNGTPRIRAAQQKQTDAKKLETIDKPLPQLDGTSDYFNSIQSSRNEEELCGSVCLNSDCDCSADEHYGCTASVPRSKSFTLFERTTSKSSNEQGNGFTPAHPPHTQESTASHKANNAPKDQKKHAEATNTPHIIDLTTPPRAKERKFGQELNTNPKVAPIQVRKSPRIRKIMEEAATSKENLPAVRPMKPLESIKKTNEATRETKKRKTAPADPQISKQKKMRTMVPEATTHVQPKLQVGLTAGFLSPPETKTTNRPVDPLKVTMHFAKRPPMPALDGVTTLAWEAFQNAGPAPASKICYCHKPASYGTSKKGVLPQIAQCTNRDCQFQWYHYACLGQSDKGKSRWGTLTCTFCRNEERFAEQNKQNGWSMLQQIGFEMGLMKADVEAQLTGLGGRLPMANPYGLGIESGLASTYGNKVQTSTLGALEKLGYPESHPGMLEQAYLNPDAYADLRAERTEAETGYDFWMHETHIAGNGEYDDEEAEGGEDDVLGADGGGGVVGCVTEGVSRGANISM